MIQAAVYLVLFLFWGSFIVWWKLIVRIVKRQPLLESVAVNQPTWRSFPELTVVILALAYVGLAIFAVSRRDQPVEHLDRNLVLLQTEIHLGLALFLTLTLMVGGRSLADYGISWNDFRRQLRTGVLGFLAVVLPMAVSIAATYQFRSRETEHALLKLLDESSDRTTLVAVMAAAMIAAPLWEELQFRVILQGWLESLIPAPVAVVIMAFAFAMVHGWRDGMALFPLALMLGYVFHQRRSYLAVVVIHSLFNATMLTLQLLTTQETP